MASLGQLVIELAANSARLQSDLGKAVGYTERAAAKFKTAFRFAGGGLLGAAIASTVKQSIQFGDEIQKAATKSGIGAKQMSELAYAAKLADVDIGSLSTAIKKMQVSLSEAGTGAKGPTQALAALGLTIEQLQKRKPEAQFELIADRISKLKDPADRARAAVELFGKAGADLLPLFAQGAAGIAKARAEAAKLGLSFSDEQIKKLSAADESVKRLDAAWKGFATTLTARVAGPLASVLDMLSGIDSRSVAKKLDDEIEAINKRLSNTNVSLGGGVGGVYGAEAAELREKLRQAYARRELLRNPTKETGGAGGRVYMGTAGGYGVAAAAQAAADAAEKARDEDIKGMEKWAREAREIDAKLTKEFLGDWSSFDGMQARYDAFIENQRMVEEAIKETQEKADAARREQANKISESAQLFKDGFLNAFDDMVNTGKFKWKELLQFMVAEFARQQIVKLFDGMGKGGLSGWIDKGVSAIGGLFGGHRANGGGVQAGKFYEVGERGRELFAPGMSGSIVPNHALGGTRNTFNIDARGADIGLAERLPRILTQWSKLTSEATEARIVERNRRGWYV